MTINKRAKLSLVIMVFAALNSSALAHIDVTPGQAQELIESTDDLIVVDVREPGEYCDAVGHIPGALNYPLNSGTLQARYEELPMKGSILVVCRSGGRSNAAANFLDSKGFSTVYDMMGGMSAWTGETVPCKYAGGHGTPEDPYQIATAAELIALGETPEDYDKHFVLTANIDLDPNLPGGRVFDRAVIAPDVNDTEYFFQGTSFTGVFNGGGHTISNLTIRGTSYLGLFGRVYGVVSHIGMERTDVNGIGDHVGGLVGYNHLGNITSCYSTGLVRGEVYVGGLVGYNYGRVTTSYSSSTVNGWQRVGGLAGTNAFGYRVGTVANCYSNGTVHGTGDYVGGLLGRNCGSITTSYSTGMVSGTSEYVGGLAGEHCPSIGIVESNFWDMETSGQLTSGGGIGKTTVEMQTGSTFFSWACGNEAVWTIDEGNDYPRLWWENTPGEMIKQVSLPGLLLGSGTDEDPYLIYTAEELNVIGLALCDWGRHFRLMADIDMSGFDGKGGRPSFNIIGTLEDPFTGFFDGNGCTISHLTVEGINAVGFFGHVSRQRGMRGPRGGVVTNLGIVNCSVTGFGNAIGGLAGINRGHISNCFNTGTVSGSQDIGGLVGYNDTWTYSTGFARLLGDGQITNCYSVSTVIGENRVGGLVGTSSSRGSISNCYACSVSGLEISGGGLVGYNWGTSITSSFWDVESSGQPNMCGLQDPNAVGCDDSYGKTAIEMQTATTFLDAGWDFVGETVNGPNDVWTIVEGQTCPLLSWQKYGGGMGDPNDPYLIYTAEHLNALGAEPNDYDKHFKLMADIDLSGYVYDTAVIAPDVINANEWLGSAIFDGTPFTGIFDGNGHTISQLTIVGDSYLGLFGLLDSGANISNVYLEAVDINGTGSSVGGLVGRNDGSVTACYSTGMVTGNYYVGGLVGSEFGSIVASFSSGTVSGESSVGGLVGDNSGSIVASCSSASANGTWNVGGLVGDNIFGGSIVESYSRGAVIGTEYVGGLVGRSVYRDVCYNEFAGSTTMCFWDVQTSGQATSQGGTGLTTDEMLDVETFLSVGWDFVDETFNGACDFWRMSIGHYPLPHHTMGVAPSMPEGQGTTEQPYLIRDARDLGTVWFKPLAHYRLETSLDLSGITWSMAVVPWFGGSFDGNGYVIGSLHIQGSQCLALFDRLEFTGSISNLGMESVEVRGTSDYIGSLVARNWGGDITMSYSTGIVSGQNVVGGLVGYNSGSIVASNCSGTVIGGNAVGGLVGSNWGGSVTQGYNTCTVSGKRNIGGLVGEQLSCDSLTEGESTGSVSGEENVGDLVGVVYSCDDSGFGCL